MLGELKKNGKWVYDLSVRLDIILNPEENNNDKSVMYLHIYKCVTLIVFGRCLCRRRCFLVLAAEMKTACSFQSLICG